jgi:hypothetical protein
MPVLGICANAFRAAYCIVNKYLLPTLGSEKWGVFWGLKFKI